MPNLVKARWKKGEEPWSRSPEKKPLHAVISGKKPDSVSSTTTIRRVTSSRSPGPQTSINLHRPEQARPKQAPLHLSKESSDKLRESPCFGAAGKESSTTGVVDSHNMPEIGKSNSTSNFNHFCKSNTVTNSKSESSKSDTKTKAWHAAQLQTSQESQKRWEEAQKRIWEQWQQQKEDVEGDAAVSDNNVNDYSNQLLQYQ